MVQSVVMESLLYRSDCRNILSNKCTSTSPHLFFNHKVMGERDILGTQLIRRNDELALLYEKIKIQKSTLTKGGTDRHTYSHMCNFHRQPACVL